MKYTQTAEFKKFQDSMNARNDAVIKLRMTVETACDNNDEIVKTLREAVHSLAVFVEGWKENKQREAENA